MPLLRSRQSCFLRRLAGPYPGCRPESHGTKHVIGNFKRPWRQTVYPPNIGFPFAVYLPLRTELSIVETRQRFVVARTDLIKSVERPCLAVRLIVPPLILSPTGSDVKTIVRQRRLGTGIVNPSARAGNLLFMQRIRNAHQLEGVETDSTTFHSMEPRAGDPINNRLSV